MVVFVYRIPKTINNMKTKKFMLAEQDMPTKWYNIVADMPNKPLPALDPVTRQPVTFESLSRVFGEELVKQELSEERFIEIPDEDVPMADVPKTGDMILPVLSTAIASGAVAIFVGKNGKKRDEE